MSDKKPASALSVTTVIVREAYGVIISILSVLSRLNPKLKILFYGEQNFENDLAVLQENDRVLFLALGTLSASSINKLKSNVTRNGATILGILDKWDGESWAERLPPHRHNNSRQYDLIFGSPICEAGRQDEFYIRHFYHPFTEWDRACEDLLFSSDIREIITACIPHYVPSDTDRVRHICRRFSAYLTPDSEMKKMISEHRKIVRTQKKAVKGAKDLGDGIFKFVQPEGSCPYALDELRTRSSLVIQHMFPGMEDEHYIFHSQCYHCDLNAILDRAKVESIQIHSGRQPACFNDSYFLPWGGKVKDSLLNGGHTVRINPQDLNRMIQICRAHIILQNNSSWRK